LGGSSAVTGSCPGGTISSCVPTCRAMRPFWKCTRSSWRQHGAGVGGMRQLTRCLDLDLCG
jgi:hypothetical protein